MKVCARELCMLFTTLLFDPLFHTQTTKSFLHRKFDFLYLLCMLLANVFECVLARKHYEYIERERVVPTLTIIMMIKQNSCTGISVSCTNKLVWKIFNILLNDARGHHQHHTAIIVVATHKVYWKTFHTQFTAPFLKW